MELIGNINRRKVYYIQIRNNSDWITSLPNKDWVAFTIANIEDEELVSPAVKVCLDRNVSYTCSAGTMAHLSEDYFDEEISWRGVEYEMRTKKEFDYNFSPVTTAHTNFSEGFWFASMLAEDEYFDIDKVVCIDFTYRKVKNHLINLINKMNKGWLPSDKKIELPEYDS